MNKNIIFWIVVLLIFAIVMSLIIPFTREVVEEPKQPEVFVNNPTAKDELMKIRNNQTKEVVEIIQVNITDASTENIQALKDARKVEENWTYYYHPNNSACYSWCNFGDCTVLVGWCDENETVYLEGIINV